MHELKQRDVIKKSLDFSNKEGGMPPPFSVVARMRPNFGDETMKPRPFWVGGRMQVAVLDTT